MSNWMTSGSARLKAKQNRSFAQRAQQRARVVAAEVMTHPPHHAVAATSSTGQSHPHTIRTRRGMASRYSYGNPIHRRGVVVSVGPDYPNSPQPPAPGYHYQEEASTVAHHHTSDYMPPPPYRRRRIRDPSAAYSRIQPSSRHAPPNAKNQPHYNDGGAIEQRQYPARGNSNTLVYEQQRQSPVTQILPPQPPFADRPRPGYLLGDIFPYQPDELQQENIPDYCSVSYIDDQYELDRPKNSGTVSHIPDSQHSAPRGGGDGLPRFQKRPLEHLRVDTLSNIMDDRVSASRREGGGILGATPRFQKRPLEHRPDIFDEAEITTSNHPLCFQGTEDALDEINPSEGASRQIFDSPDKQYPNPRPVFRGAFAPNPIMNSYQGGGICNPPNRKDANRPPSNLYVPAEGILRRTSDLTDGRSLDYFDGDQFESAPAVGDNEGFGAVFERRSYFQGRTQHHQAKEDPANSGGRAGGFARFQRKQCSQQELDSATTFLSETAMESDSSQYDRPSSRGCLEDTQIYSAAFDEEARQDYSVEHQAAETNDSSSVGIRYFNNGVEIDIHGVPMSSCQQNANDTCGSGRNNARESGSGVVDTRGGVVNEGRSSPNDDDDDELEFLTGVQEARHGRSIWDSFKPTVKSR